MFVYEKNVKSLSASLTANAHCVGILVCSLVKVLLVKNSEILVLSYLAIIIPVCLSVCLSNLSISFQVFVHFIHIGLSQII